ncbi:hypothetical protein ACWQ06_04225 [Streptomyces angustmyceticus]
MTNKRARHPAALRFFPRLKDCTYVPRASVTDELRSHGATHPRQFLPAFSGTSPHFRPTTHSYRTEMHHHRFTT